MSHDEIMRVERSANGQSCNIKCSTTDVLSSHGDTMIYIAKKLVIVLVKFYKTTLQNVVQPAVKLLPIKWVWSQQSGRGLIFSCALHAH